MKNDKRILSCEERDFLVGIDVSIDIVGDTNPDIGRRVMGEVVEVQDHVGEPSGVILLCEGEFNHASPFDGEKEARADALRMARVVYDMQSFDCSTCVRRDCPFGENDICNECSECDKWEAREDSDAFEANEIIAKYEEK